MKIQIFALKYASAADAAYSKNANFTPRLEAICNQYDTKSIEAVTAAVAQSSAKSGFLPGEYKIFKGLSFLILKILNFYYTFPSEYLDK